jgi:hypothetical protein
MSPSDLGQLLKPFVFLDRFDLTARPEGPSCIHTRESPP